MKSQSSQMFEPIVQVLQNIEFWLARQGVSRLIVAADDYQTMRERELPSHVGLRPRKPQGARIAQRGSRMRNPQRTTLAVWPEDGVSEYTMPMLCFVVAGKVDLRVADYVLHCQAHDIVYMPAGIPKCNVKLPHFEGDSRGRSCDLFWVHPYISPRGMKCYMCHSIESRHISARAGEHGFTENLLIQQIFTGLCEPIEKRGNEETVNRMMSLLIHLLLEQIKANSLLPAPDFAQPMPGVSHRSNSIEHACAYMESHLQSNLTIETVAKQVYLSPSLFSQHFRRHTGQSFKAYLTEQRMNRAFQLLAGSDYTIEEVGRLVGLKGSQLRALFREHHGCSPMEFRKKQLDL